MMRFASAAACATPFGVVHARDARGDQLHVVVELRARRRVGAADEEAEDGPVLRAPRRQSGAAGPAAFLAPSARLERMVAVDAAHVGELGPLVAAGVTREVVERLAEGGGLADGEGARAVRVGGDVSPRRQCGGIVSV